MKKHSSAAVAFLLAALLAAMCLLGACGKNGNGGGNSGGSGGGSGASDAAKPDSGKTNNGGGNGGGEALTPGEKGTLTKLQDMDLSGEGYDSSSPGTGAFVYSKDGKKGVRSFNGTDGTDAVYTEIDEDSGYYIVTKAETDKTVDDVASFNVFGLIDSTGREIIPEEYAKIDVDGGFAQAIKVTGTTENEDEAILFLTDSAFHLGPDEEDTLLTGEWVAYDLGSGSVIPGVGGSHASDFSAVGDKLCCDGPDGGDVYVDAKGSKLPAQARVFSDGSYEVENDDGATLYAPDGQVGFSYTDEQYDNLNYGDEDGIYVMNKGDSCYVVDGSGKVLSSALGRVDTAYSEMALLADGTVVDLTGKKLTEGSFDGLATENGYYLATNYSDNSLVLLAADGKEIFRGVKEQDGLGYSVSDVCVYQEKEGGVYQYLNFATGAFDIAGKYGVFGRGLVEVEEADGSRSLVSYLTGEKLLANYETLHGYEDRATGAVIIAAEKTEDVWEIYSY